MISDEQYMLRCLELARLGMGNVSPNPLVACLIVYKDTIIGEGYHRHFGEAHAEVKAIDSVKDKSLLKHSTLYVNLEPCAHHGKTPPCADRIIREGIPRVVISCRDPFPEVNGKGIEKLKAAGIDVTTGILEKEGRELNRAFFTFHEKKRPFIILKWAETMDGFIARKDFTSKWISNPYSRLIVHKWRAETDAVIVGTNTALHDNPELTCREFTGRNPVRITIDRYGKLPTSHNLFDGNATTWIFTESTALSHPNVRYIPIDFNEKLPGQICHILYQNNIQSIIIEGGANLLSQFIDNNLWDEARVFKSRITFNEGITAPFISSDHIKERTIDTDKLIIYQNI